MKHPLKQKAPTAGAGGGGKETLSESLAALPCRPSIRLLEWYQRDPGRKGWGREVWDDEDK